MLPNVLASGPDATGRRRREHVTDNPDERTCVLPLEEQFPPVETHHPLRRDPVNICVQPDTRSLRTGAHSFAAVDTLRS